MAGRQQDQAADFVDEGAFDARRRQPLDRQLRAFGLVVVAGRVVDRVVEPDAASIRLRCSSGKSVEAATWARQSSMCVIV
ncbi:hypothetical protein [Brevundimonas sp.]|uniref:hypothetical protein n=1 Tax=Brevundimonas sp. TaxID=1871086 RepID=UPI003568316B